MPTKNLEDIAKCMWKRSFEFESGLSKEDLARYPVITDYYVSVIYKTCRECDGKNAGCRHYFSAGHHKNTA